MRFPEQGSGALGGPRGLWEALQQTYGIGSRTLTLPPAEVPFLWLTQAWRSFHFMLVKSSPHSQLWSLPEKEIRHLYSSLLPPSVTLETLWIEATVNAFLILLVVTRLRSTHVNPLCSVS